MADTGKLTARVRASVRSASPYNAVTPPCRIRLNGNESPFSLPPEMLVRALDEISKVPFNRYPDPECSGLRRAVSVSEGVSPESVVFGNGSDELIQIVLEVFCGGSGAVLVPSPTFSMYALTASVLGRKVVTESLDAGFDLDESAMLRAMKESDPDVVFLASPNSPTGNLLSPERVEAVVSAAPGIVVVDEAYYHFCGVTHIPLMERFPNLAVLRTFSKIGFAAMRLGVLFMHPDLAAQAHKARLPYNVNSLTQAAARVCFENTGVFEENINIIKSEREKMFKTLGSIAGVKVFPSNANFFLIQFDGAKTAGEVHRALIEKGILTRSFPDADMADCLRVTIGLPEENREFEDGLRAIISGL